MDTRKLFGTGFLASIAGIELTNIIIFSRLGYEYGLYSFLLIIVATLPLPYLQQVVVLPTVLCRRDMHRELESMNNLVYSIYLYSIYSASILTLVVNTIGLAVIYSFIMGSKWMYYSLLLVAIIWAISINKLFELKAMKILTVFSIILAMVYILLLFINTPTLVNTPIHVRHNVSAIDMLALWGAIAAPYSIYMQVIDSESTIEDRFRDVYTGAVVNVLIGVAIASTSILYNYTCSSYSIGYVIKPFESMGLVPLILYLVGLTSSVVLASLSIEYVVSDIMARRIPPRTRARGVLNYLLLALVVVTVSYCGIIASTIDFIVDLMVYCSAIIGLLFTITILCITVYYMSRYNVDSLYKRNIIPLTILSGVTLYISVASIAEIL